MDKNLNDLLDKPEKNKYKVIDDDDGSDLKSFDSFDEMMQDYQDNRTIWDKIEFALWTGPKMRLDEFKFKWGTKISRFRKGYAPCDVWNMNSWFINHAVPILKDLRKTTNGYPAGLSEQAWDDVLTEMIEGFEIAKAVNGHDAIFKDDYNKANPSLQKVYRDQGIKLVSKKEYDRAFELFHEYFFNLWD